MRRDANANKISAAVFLSSLAALLALAVLSSVLAFGDRLSAAHPVFGVVFYLVLRLGRCFRSIAFVMSGGAPKPCGVVAYATTCSIMRP